MSAEEEKVHQFAQLTDTSEDIARQYLANTDFNLEAAINNFYGDGSLAGSSKTESSGTQSAPLQQPPASASASSSSSAPASSSTSRPKPRASQVRTFRDLSNANDDDDSDDPEKNLFTGGEKSGLQVENPENKRRRQLQQQSRNRNPLGLVEDLMKKAEEEANLPDTRESAKEHSKPKKNFFTGTGHKLGSVENEIESTEIGSKKPTGFQRPEKVTRTITFWKEGFQVEDGELYKYDDPTNADYLTQLNQGRAPLSLLNVEMFQDVDVNVVKKLDESFKPPKRKAGGFHGEGHRLGSPVPFEPSSHEDADVGGASGLPDAPTEAKVENKVEQEEEGDSKIQIRLANGKRIVKKFQSTDPVSVLYEFVSSNTEVNGREWSLAIAFPLTIIDDLKEKSIKEAGLVNSVVVQRWK
ncbi:unnamed protein product [Ambrosiozyma monospora]|uniref:Unnamed protein product n=1 Tax=Ambrosiozyma monospora TaxID=43982 RepID=A0ACB5T369_AMBMO|nr:unnamed protein product [Ambrosiozyma monospora]